MHDPLTRMLMSNCKMIPLFKNIFLISAVSENIAPTLVAIDGLANGYRKFLLPLASQNSLVRDALLASSASHLSQKRTGLEKEAMNFQQAAIRSLRKSSDPNDERSDSAATLATILLLLVNDMGNGGSDFEILSKMAKAWISVTEHKSSSHEQPMVEFIKDQINT